MLLMLCEKSPAFLACMNGKARKKQELEFQLKVHAAFDGLGRTLMMASAAARNCSLIPRPCCSIVVRSRLRATGVFSP